MDPPGGQKPRPAGGIVTALFLLGGALSAPGSAVAVFSDGKAGFAVKVGEEICPYTVLGVYVLPGEQLAIEVIDPPAGERFILEAAEAAVTRSAAGAWTWTAPALAGLYTIEIHRAGTGDAIRLNAFVLVPYERLKDGYLDGYQIGSYPRRPLKDLEIYRTPRGFIEVTPEIEATPISPHFTLREFICKQKAEYPKYVALRERLLLKLEYLLEKANESGYRCESFVVMSGYRTPHYNAAIGNVRYSRH